MRCVLICSYPFKHHCHSKCVFFFRIFRDIFPSFKLPAAGSSYPACCVVWMRLGPRPFPNYTRFTKQAFLLERCLLKPSMRKGLRLPWLYSHVIVVNCKVQCVYSSLSVNQCNIFDYNWLQLFFIQKCLWMTRTFICDDEWMISPIQKSIQMKV